MARQVLSMNGQVQVIDARGRRRQLRVGERLAKEERLELADGAELILRHADGREERLQGQPLQRERGEPVDRLDAWLALPDDADPPVQHKVRSLREAPLPKLFNQARPEAGLLPGGAEASGHGFVRVERVQFSIPRAPFEMVTVAGLPSPTVETASQVSPLDPVRQPSPALLARQPGNVAPLIARLREGGSEEVNDERTQITSETLLTSALLLDENGVPLSFAQPLVLRQQFSMVTISLQGEEEGQFRWLLIRQTLDHLEQMPEIPFGTVVHERYTISLQGGGSLTLVNQVEGAEDFLEDEVIVIEEQEDYSALSPFFAPGSTMDSLSTELQLQRSSQEQLEKMGVAG